jgi:hypothetical protein
MNRGIEIGINWRGIKASKPLPGNSKEKTIRSCYSSESNRRPKSQRSIQSRQSERSRDKSLRIPS